MPQADLVGVDPSFAMTARTREAVRGLPRPTPSALVAVGRAEQLPFQSGAFDLVLSTPSARHWSDPRRAAAEIRRVAAAGASLVIADSRPQHHHPGTDPLLVALARSGLRVRDVEPLRAASLLADVELIVATA